jgi:C-terminal processing protease CtpA/Prc
VAAAYLFLVRPVRATLAFIFAIVMVGSVYADEPGIVGIRLDDSDFRVVARVAPDSPAARAGVQTGDRIIGVNGYPTSQLHNAHEFSSRADGAAGTDLELQLHREGAPQPLLVHMRRVPLSTIDLSESHGEIRYKDGHVEVIPGK